MSAGGNGTRRESELMQTLSQQALGEASAAIAAGRVNVAEHMLSIARRARAQAAGMHEFERTMDALRHLRLIRP